MSSTPATGRTTTAFDVLADPRRRYLLSTLQDRSDPLALETLATEVTVAEQDSQIVTDDQVRPVHVELVHSHVPRLLDVGLLTEVTDGTDGGRRTLTLADHPLLEIDWVTRLLENPAVGPACDEDELNRTLEVLVPVRRRAICLVLARRRDDLTVADLAATLVTARDDAELVDGDESQVETRLVHDDLPALADAGLLEYDRGSGRVVLETDAAQWRTDWLAVLLQETSDSVTDDGSDGMLVGQGTDHDDGQFGQLDA